MPSIKQRLHRLLNGFGSDTDHRTVNPKNTSTAGSKQASKAVIVDAYLHEEICRGTVVIEGLGKRPKGSSLYLLRELMTGRYGDLDIYWIVNDQTAGITASILQREQIGGVHLVDRNSDEYKRLMFRAEYLFNEVVYPVWWIKKPGQTYVNLWHGTPLKRLGKKRAGIVHKDAPASHNFTMADYMLMPSDYCIKHLLDDWDVLGITCAKGLMLGYPRTGILFDEAVRAKVRSACGLEGKHVIVWTPTWSEDDDPEDVKGFLPEIDRKLRDDQVLFVNLHHRTSEYIDYGEFGHIHEFPADYDVYEFLTAADIMITNYSSIFFDFAVTRRKIILHCPDRDEYLTSRGLYIALEDLPFPVTTNTEELIEEINRGKGYEDKEFLRTFNRYDSIENAKRLCDAVFLGRTNEVEIRTFVKNRNVVFLVADSFRPGQVSNWLMELYADHAWSEDDYLSFPEKAAEEEIERVDPMLRGVRIFATKGKSMGETIDRRKLYGDMEISRFVLLDPENHARIRSFACFPEPVQLLLTERQMEPLRSGHKKMTAAVKKFSDAGKEISVLQKSDADWLRENLEITADVISTKEAFREKFFAKTEKTEKTGE